MRSLTLLLIAGAIPFIASADPIPLSPDEVHASIEARGEREKFIACAQFFVLQHAKEYPKANDLFHLALMTACSAYLDAYEVAARSASNLKGITPAQNTALLAVQIKEAIDAAYAVADKDFPLAKQLK